jgi:hypothetical protein
MLPLPGIRKLFSSNKHKFQFQLQVFGMDWLVAVSGVAQEEEEADAKWNATAGVAVVAMSMPVAVVVLEMVAAVPVQLAVVAVPLAQLAAEGLV